MTQISAAEFRKLTRKKPSKYLNKKTVVDGIKFDSKKEAGRWVQLKILESKGEIEELMRQRRYDLRVKDVIICSYVADFTYWRCGFHVEDVKSDFTRKNPVYRIKKKLMKAIYGIDIKEV